LIEDGARLIEVRFGPEFPFAQLYAPPGEELIAYEPMAAPTNALLAGGPDLTVLEPGGSWSGSFEIEVAGS
jgi:galactose mutarotase-like enzyme